MSIYTHVPADEEATSILSLVEDCREVSGVLAPFVPHGVRIPDTRGALPVEIRATTASGLDGWGDYGS